MSGCLVGRAYHAVLAVQAVARPMAVLASALRAAWTAALRRGDRPRRQSACVTGRAVMKSTVGRPRRVTDEDVARILAWDKEVRAWRAKGAGLKSRRELARELGISPSTVTYIISRAGQYKLPSPEKRGEELEERHEHVAHLRTRGLL